MFILLTLTFLWQKWMISIPLSGTDIGLFINGDPASSVLLYNMHDNENTSALAGRIISSNYGGQYYEMAHNGDRNIEFSVGEGAHDIKGVSNNKEITIFRIMILSPG